jgi:hypothetical protein
MNGRRRSESVVSLSRRHRNIMMSISMRIILGLVVCVWAVLSVGAFNIQGRATVNHPLPVDQASIHVSTQEASQSISSSRRAFLGSVASAGLVIAGLPKEAPAKEGMDSSVKSTSLEIADTAAAVDWNGIFQKARNKALSGGKAGASASVVQVLSLMWLRTSMNYQYRYGGNLVSSLQTLWNEGGIPRLYQGLPFAIVQGPLTRFGDTAANVGILALLETTPETQALPLPVKTALGSIMAGLWRIFLMPIDSSKTAMQVEGADGLKNLWSLVGNDGPSVLYQGAVASAAATAAGHFPWYLTYNYLNDVLPQVSSSEDLLLSLARSASLGFAASCVSDTVSNSLRVIKTTKQTARLSKSKGDTKDATSDGLSYPEVVKLILEEDGFVGLFGRGLQTRLITNSIQGAVFSVLWRYFQQSNGL